MKKNSCKQCVFWLLVAIIVWGGCLRADKKLPVRKPPIGFFLHTGVNYPSYPADFSRYYIDNYNLGAGCILELSRRFSFRLAFSYQTFHMKRKYLGLVPIENTQVWLQGPVSVLDKNHFYSFYNWTLNVKYRIIPDKSFSPYLTLGGGLATIRRWAGTFEPGFPSSYHFFTSYLNRYLLITGGGGLEYRLPGHFGFFAEIQGLVCYDDRFIRNPGGRVVYIPLKIGFNYHLNPR